MTGAEHMAARPSWDCSACDQPWPCANAKTNMLDEYAGNLTALTVYLAGCFQDATHELTSHGRSAPVDLYERFLGWMPASSR